MLGLISLKMPGKGSDRCAFLFPIFETIPFPNKILGVFEWDKMILLGKNDNLIFEVSFFWRNEILKTTNVLNTRFKWHASCMHFHL